jgi:DNA-binding NarL/FixJ family response regulator
MRPCAAAIGALPLTPSPRTAEHHVSAVLSKLEAGSRRDVVRRAEDLGII